MTCHGALESLALAEGMIFALYPEFDPDEFVDVSPENAVGLMSRWVAPYTDGTHSSRHLATAPSLPERLDFITRQLVSAGLTRRAYGWALFLAAFERVGCATDTDPIDRYLRLIENVHCN
jgi:hypothetical protein